MAEAATQPILSCRASLLAIAVFSLLLWNIVLHLSRQMLVFGLSCREPETIAGRTLGSSTATPESYQADGPSFRSRVVAGPFLEHVEIRSGCLKACTHSACIT